MLNRLARLFPILLVLSLATGSAHAAESQAGLQLDPKIGLKAVAALVDQQLAGSRTSLRALALTENVMSGDWERIKGPLSEFAKDVPTAVAVWFAKPDGSYYTVALGRTDQNLGDRNYFAGLIAGKEVIGDLVVSKSAGNRSTIIAEPVSKDGNVVGALGVTISMRKVALQVDDSIGFPKDVMFYALDRRGQTALHRESTLLFDFPQQMDSPSLKAAVEEMLAKPEGAVRYEFQGTQREAIFMRSNLTGWVYALRW